MILIDLPSPRPSPTSLVLTTSQMLPPDASCPSDWKAGQEHRPALYVVGDNEESHSQDCERWVGEDEREGMMKR